MLKLMMAATAAFAASVCATVSTQVPQAATAAEVVNVSSEQDVATITALEDRFSQAVMARDMAFLEEMLAPEFEVHGWLGRRYGFTKRAQWMKTVPAWHITEHPTKVLHVRLYGDTAVATLKGKLVAEENGRTVRNNEWVVADTWMRRNGRWQLVFKYADEIPST